MFKSKILPVLIAVVPFVIFLMHIKTFGNYLVDDIGILFAYAGNIANGHGIVSQPGLMPVEGCSDFLWMMLFVPFFDLNIFNPVITTKIFCAGFILLLYLFFAFRFNGELPSLLIFLFFVFLSISTPFAIWNCSGLENPLYVTLIVFLFYYSHKTTHQQTSDRRVYIITGFIAFLIAITRPDGVLYSFAPPMLAAAHYLLHGKIRSLPCKHFFIYSLVFGASFGLFLIFRYSYFGELVPNTYFFKGGPKKADFIDILLLQEVVILKLQKLFSSVINVYAFAGIAVILILNCWIYFTKRFNELHLSITVFFAFSILNFLLLPYDWMAEFRFATPFIFFFYLMLISSLHTLFSPCKYCLISTCIPLLILFYFIGRDFQRRSIEFSKHPTVPFETIRTYTALPFNAYAEKLDLKNASLLTPDCGATLYYSNLRIFDMAGLIDKRYAVSTMGKNSMAFNRLVFEIDKPTFIEIHSDWSDRIALHNDARLYHDYLPIWEQQTTLYGRNIINGHYVRRDAIKEVFLNDITFLQRLSAPTVRLFNTYNPY